MSFESTLTYRDAMSIDDVKHTREDLERRGVTVIDSTSLRLAVDKYGYVNSPEEEISYRNFPVHTYMCEKLDELLERRKDQNVYIYWNVKEDSPYWRQVIIYDPITHRPKVERQVRIISKENHPDFKPKTNSCIKSKQDKRLLLLLQ